MELVSKIFEAGSKAWLVPRVNILELAEIVRSGCGLYSANCL